MAHVEKFIISFKKDKKSCEKNILQLEFIYSIKKLTYKVLVNLELKYYFLYLKLNLF